MKSFVKKKDGTTAIEFSLLFMPYLMLTLGIIELSMMYVSASILEGATNSASRMIRTGQLQESTEDPETLFREQICSYTTVLIDCNEVQVEVVTLDGFADFENYPPEYDEDGNLISQGFTPGGSSQDTLVRVAYRYEMMTPFIGTLLTGPTNSRLFMSTIVFQNEPYDFEESAL